MRSVSATLLAAALAAGLTVFAVADTPDYAAAARDASARLAAAQAELADASRAATASPGEASDFQLLMARSVLRAVGQTLLQELAARRGADAALPAALTPDERELAIACRRVEFEAALRHGVIVSAEEELARLRPWIERSRPDLWSECVEAVARLEYFLEPALPGGDALATRAAQHPPTAALLAEAEALARAHPDRLRAELPRLILYRRLGREAEIDAVLSAWQRRAPHVRSIPQLARDLRERFSPATPTAARFHGPLHRSA